MAKPSGAFLLRFDDAQAASQQLSQRSVAQLEQALRDYLVEH
ncbi:hypothetical protein SAMN02745166_05052, partial [Prosthecobacter debontii]